MVSGPHVSESGEFKLGSTRVKLARVDPGLVAGKARDSGGVRVSSSGDRLAGGGHLRDVGTRPRRVVWVVGPGVAGVIVDVEFGSGRSSGELGLVARGHGEARGLVRWVPGGAVGLVETVAWSLGGRSLVSNELRGGACG